MKFKTTIISIYLLKKARMFEFSNNKQIRAMTGTPAFLIAKVGELLEKRAVHHRIFQTCAVY